MWQLVVFFFGVCTVVGGAWSYRLVNRGINDPEIRIGPSQAAKPVVIIIVGLVLAGISLAVR